MNQSQLFSLENKLSDNWKPHRIQPDVFVNIISQQQIKKFFLKLSQAQDVYYRKRMHQNNPYIAKVRYYHIKQIKNCSGKKVVQIYVDRMLPINQQNWIPANTALTVLKAFRRLSSVHGVMRVNEQMISMNQKGQLKIWINDNPIINKIKAKASSQQQMLADIIRVIINYDPETASRLRGCKSINQAINRTLVSLTFPKTHRQVSKWVQIRNQKIFYNSGRYSRQLKRSCAQQQVFNTQSFQLQEKKIEDNLKKPPTFTSTYRQTLQKERIQRKASEQTSCQKKNSPLQHLNLLLDRKSIANSVYSIQVSPQQTSFDKKLRTKKQIQEMFLQLKH